MRDPENAIATSGTGIKRLPRTLLAREGAPVAEHPAGKIELQRRTCVKHGEVVPKDVSVIASTVPRWDLSKEHFLYAVAGY